MKRLLAVLIGVAAGVGCATSVPTSQEDVTQESETVVRYQGTELEALLSFRWADGHVGDEWLVLVVSLSGGRAATTRVDRESIRVRGPDGTRYPLPSQQAFRDAYGEILPMLRAIDAINPPAGEFGGIRQPCGRWFLAGPWDSFAYDTIDVTPLLVCSGPIVFLVPGGVQPGPWVLEIDLQESKVRIPFVLGEGARG
jgi:hypothetical protein